jgi:integrase
VKGNKTKVSKSSTGTKWRLRVFVGRDAEGKQRYETKTYVGTAREADEELAAMIVDAHPAGAGPTEIAGKRTFAAALEHWRKVDASNLKPSTLRGYESNYAKHVLPRFSDVRVSKITPASLELFYAELYASGLKPATVHQIHTSISAVLSTAVRLRWLARNPARETRRQRIEWRPPTAPVRDDLPALLAELTADDDLDMRSLVLVAVATGARRGELCALRWSDLDRRRKRLTIARSIYATKRERIEGDTKTHAERVVTLPAYALEALEARRARAELWAERCGGKLARDGFVFSDEPRGLVPWRPDFVTFRWIRARNAAGLTKVRFHDLRHFAASEALANGADVATVRDRLGHRSLATTSLYVHGRDDADEELAQRDDDGIGRILGE